jgi:lipoyl(octanoyl) transferase
MGCVGRVEACPQSYVQRQARRLRHFIIAIKLVRWRLLLSPPLGGPENMALDEALMDRARSTGETVLRVYGWSSPVLSLGRNQRALGIYDENLLRERSVGVVRRPTGGRALLHHHEVTYSVTAPATDAEPMASTYGRINALLLRGLASLGVDASLAEPRSRAAQPSALPCFAEPARGEIVLAGRKLAGSAQWRHDGALLQHGSIIVQDDQPLIRDLMREASSPAPAAATLAEAMGRVPSLAEVAESLFDAVRRQEDDSATVLIPATVDALQVSALLARYRDPAWTWRR